MLRSMGLPSGAVGTVAAATHPGAPSALRAVAVAVALVFSVLPAHAGLFDDEEARKAILDLRTRVLTHEEQTRVRLTELGQTNDKLSAANTQLTQSLSQQVAANAQMATQVAEQMAAMRRSLVDLNNQLESLRADLARLRGQDEQIVRDVAELQRRQRDVGQTLDDRLRRLEPVKATVDGREVMVDPEEKRSFDEAMTTLRGGDFERAVGALSAFQRRWTASAYLPQARFWLGNALYGKRLHAEAITSWRAFLAESPAHVHAPDALLAMATSQVEMKDPKAARRTLEDLVRLHPQSEAAQAGRQRLSTLPK